MSIDSKVTENFSPSVLSNIHIKKACCAHLAQIVLQMFEHVIKLYEEEKEEKHVMFLNLHFEFQLHFKFERKFIQANGVNYIIAHCILIMAY